MGREAQAYRDMWAATQAQDKETFAWLTTKGVVVLPITHNSQQKQSDYSVLPIKKINGNLHVQFSGQWLLVVASVHTHPDNANMLSEGDIYMAAQWGVATFAIEPTNVWVGYGPYFSNAKYHQEITASQNVLSGNLSIYRDLLPLLPK